MKAVLTAKLGSGYDDVLEERYHFPSTYLGQVRNAIDDFVVYYEPRRRDGAATGGRQAYFAVARIIGVEADPGRDGHFYARLKDYLDFDSPVPFRREGRFLEAGLQREDGETNKGAFGRSVRNITDMEFDLILREGFSVSADETMAAVRPAPEGFDEDISPFRRPVVEMTGTRLFRDRAFARHVQSAYSQTCALTGLQIINGGGRPEVQAAHIRPVASDGSDSVRNGLALSSTLHWMFDRGLVSVGPDYEILVARSGVPDQIGRLLNPDRRMRLPAEPERWPHQHYLGYHRDVVFKG